jgi:hypothetical protein
MKRHTFLIAISSVVVLFSVLVVAKTWSQSEDPARDPNSLIGEWKVQWYTIEPFLDENGKPVEGETIQQPVDAACRWVFDEHQIHVMTLDQSTNQWAENSTYIYSYGNREGHRQFIVFGGCEYTFKGRHVKNVIETDQLTGKMVYHVYKGTFVELAATQSDKQVLIELEKIIPPAPSMTPPQSKINVEGENQ